MEDSEFEGSEFQHQTAEDHKIEFPEIQQPLETNNPNGSNERGQWSSRLCACCNNPCNALVTILVPCVTFGQIAEMVDEGNISCCVSAMLYLGSMVTCCIGAMLALATLGCICRCMPCKLSTKYRTKLREKFNIAEGPAPDEVTHYLCECCALCQEYRELQSRGFHPSLGWNKNEARNKIKNQQLATKPPLNQRMMK